MSIDLSNDYIPYHSTGYFSEFICKYLDKDAEIESLYNRFPSIENFKDQIVEKEKSYDNGNREVLVNVLTSQYEGLEISELTQSNIEALKNKNSFTITTGHQLNLFTGPLYFLYKIVSAINLADQLKKTHPQYNFIPVYWMASEDHDFEEINYFNFKGKKIQWSTSQTGAVGPFSTEGLDDVFDVISSEFGTGKNAEQLKQLFRDAYIKNNNLADATRYLANALFSQYGLIIIDANNKALKELFIPKLKQELIEQTSFTEVSKTNELLEQHGLKVQVNPREINLFYMTDGLRERIVSEDGIFSVANTDISWSKEALLMELKAHPERFSPNVIVRPLYQEFILPNLCYIGGGGEMIYWLQLKSSFKAQEVPFPILLLRNSVMLKSQKQSEKLQKLEISNTDLFLKRNSFINKRVRRISNIDIDFSRQIDHLKNQFKELYELAKLTDKSFLGAVKAQEVKQIKGLKHLEKRLLKAQKRKLKDQIERCTELQEQLFPNQSLQERNQNFSELYLEHGEQLIPFLIKNLDPLRLEFSILEL